ncbi:MAG: 3'-5' exonuclease domain-containing protein 2 [Bacteroidales bacterium]|nr:3'-5' exonuclease domain-containing protein 2 [Bacteroidales bacterium]
MYKISISPEEIDKLELVSFPGKIKVIDSVGLEFLSAVRYLKRQKIIGFDTESRPSFSPDQPHYGVSLLQLSGAEKAFLFRIKLMGGIPKPLRAVLSNENIIKVGAAVNDDVRGLEKHHDFPPRGFVDLQKIVWEYGIKDKAVKKMAAIILGIKISKTQQLSNWEAETLSDAQKAYAATDAWVCREMYLKLKASRKHPLTPEQMLPNPPKNQAKNDKDHTQERQG